jgi:hypothetical protein
MMRTSDHAEKLDFLMSIHEIRQLAYRYAYAIDSHDSDLLESLFVETDAPLAAPNIDIHMVRNPGMAPDQRGPSLLFVGNHVIDVIDSDNATGVVYCIVQIELGGDFIDQSVVYRDRYQRCEGIWRFVSREHLLWYGSLRDRNPLEQSEARWPRRQVGVGIASEVLQGAFETGNGPDAHEL